jgi:hypothetical protein
MKRARARHPVIDIVSIDRYVCAAQDTGSRAKSAHQDLRALLIRCLLVIPGSRNYP